MKREYEPATVDQHLGYLIEECGEVLAAAGKTLRWGLGSKNPEIVGAEVQFRGLLMGPQVPEDSSAVAGLRSAVILAHEGETNREWLLRELADLEGAIRRVREIL